MFSKYFSTILLVFIVSLSSFAQPRPAPKISSPVIMDSRDIAFRVIGTENATWTAYKKKKFQDGFFKFLDSNKATTTIRVALKDYVYDEKKKLTTITTHSAEFVFEEKEEEIKLRVTIEPFTVRTDSVLMALIVKKDEPTYMDVTGKISKPRLTEVQATPREKRKELRMNFFDAMVVQSADNSENPYVWKTSARIIDKLGPVIEAKQWDERFEIATFGFVKNTQR